jgi:acyl carrier protein
VSIPNVQDAGIKKTQNSTTAEIQEILVRTLGLHDRSEVLDESTQLLGSLPELDSLAVLEIITNIEEHFGFEVDEADMRGEVFETLGSLAAYVDAHRH